MRVVSASVEGFGRLLQTKVNLDSKVIAIVGPNEAGKSTFLEALAFLNDRDPLPPTRRSRAGTVADTSTVISIDCVLDDADRAAVADLDLAQAPRSVQVSRRANGVGPFLTIFPALRKNPAGLKAAVADAERLSPAVLRDVAAADVSMKDPRETSAEDYKHDWANIRGQLATIPAQLSEQLHPDAPEVDEDLVDELEELAVGLEALDAESALAVALRACKAWLERPDPTSEVRSRLWQRAPGFLIFEDDARTLRSTYELSPGLVSDPPAALSNLAQLANLDLNQLWGAVSGGDRGRQSTLLLNANQELEDRFSSAWRQSTLAVHLEMAGAVLSIMIKEDGRTITVFDERSAGLRMFVALLAFVATRESPVPPVLLVDEAETHLHFDAQADLVNVFMTQQQAAKIIYTTHSPACLPPDLGTSIRAVMPSASNPQTSSIHNSFWQGSVGFSPLLLAMGAGAAAFSQARFVVLAEGPSEMILLPSLIRTANGLDSLDYQIAPGLAEAPKRLYPDLDLEAARVAYLVDGDQGGRDLKARLIKSGIPASMIVDLGAETLENLLDPEVYAATVQELLEESSSGRPLIDFPDLTAETRPWPAVAKERSAKNGLEMPSKVAVATRIIESGVVKPSAEGKEALVALHEQVRRILKL